MDNTLSRREFLGVAGTASVASAMLTPLERSEPRPQSVAAGGVGGKVTPKGKIVLQTFDYRGVTLGPSRWQRQFQSARNYYLAVPDDDILYGFRRAAGLNAPGKVLGGWANRDSAVIFGQWLQAMARTSQANNDVEMRNKAVKLVDEWAKTLGADLRQVPARPTRGGDHSNRDCSCWYFV
jgi:hypothetical protein